MKTQLGIMRLLLSWQCEFGKVLTDQGIVGKDGGASWSIETSQKEGVKESPINE